jgi:hypothetical protein
MAAKVLLDRMSLRQLMRLKQDVCSTDGVVLSRYRSLL